MGVRGRSSPNHSPKHLQIPNTPPPNKHFLFRFALISRMVLGVGKKFEIRLKPGNFDTWLLNQRPPYTLIIASTWPAPTLHYIYYISLPLLYLYQLLSLQAVNMYVVPAVGYRLARYFQDSIGFISICGFDRLQSRVALLFDSFWSSLALSVFHCPGPLKYTSYAWSPKMTPLLCFIPYLCWSLDHFLSPPVHFAWWAHMRHFLSICLSVCPSVLDQKSD